MMKGLRLRIILPIMIVHLFAIPLLVYQFLAHLEEPLMQIQQGGGDVSALSKTLESERRKATLLTFVLLIGVFSLIYTAHYFFITRPVNEIMEAMGRVRAGDLQAKVPAIRKDELGNMATSFNKVVDSLREARSELEKRHESDMSRAEQLATVGEIAAGLAHEVKNPLAGISSALEVVLSETDEKFQHREVLHQILDEAHRINSIINQLLDYARPRATRPEWCEIRMIVGDLQSIFSPQCQRSRVTFEVQNNVEDGRIFVDSQELKQVLMNVLRNSLEAVGPGGTIRFLVDSAQSYVNFQVIDDGPGMEEATRHRIFQPFYTTKPGGTGLGLSIVNRLVGNMGGTIDVESKPGAGCRFIVRLPKGTES